MDSPPEAHGEEKKKKKANGTKHAQNESTGE